MATPMGMKKDKDKKPVYMKPRSQKLAKELRAYQVLRDQLIRLANHRSELSGKLEDMQRDPLVPHHIQGRKGQKLADPMNIICILDSEHTKGKDCVHNHNTPEKKAELLEIVKSIRKEQGYE